MNALTQLWQAVRRDPLVTFLVAAGALLLGANYHLHQEREAAAVAHDDVRRRGETMVSFLSDRAHIEADLVTVREALQAIDDHVVREESKEVNLGYFYRLERAARVRITRIDQISAAPAEAEAAYRSVPVTIRLTGSYRNLLGFLREVESGPRVLRVSQFQMERLTEGADDLALLVTLEMLARP